jgi:hypothetical protein
MDPASWDKAKDIIFEAVGLPAEDREAFVRSRCDDAALCAEIMALLTSGAAGDDFLASRTVKEPFAFSDRTADADDLEIGTKVGPYVILEHLGVGGMGRVFLGTDPRLQRRVALKCLLDSRAAGDDLRARIIREARAAARISNQHVAVVHDVIEHESRAFIVMEYVEGETLSARIKRERLSVEQTIALGRQLTSALAAAHAEGIVHRDLKPSNIQLTHAGLVKILDFGIASATRLLSSAGSGTSTTRVAAQSVTLMRGGNPGTPPYMSPEQLLGGRVDERSDLYSLGVVLFQMCTGQLPYPEKEAFQIAEAQARGVPRADAINRDIPKPFADLIARAMAMKVEERFQTALDVDGALETIERSLKIGRVDRREQIGGWLGRLAVAAPAAILGLWLIGFITSVQFNFVFGRDGQFARFGHEPWASYIVWGLLAVLPVAFVTMLAAVALIAARFTVRLLELIGPVGRFSSRVRSQLRSLAVRSGLDKSQSLAQALTGLGVATLAGLSWYHGDLIHAWSSFFNSSPIENLMPMTDSAPARWRYHIQLSVATLIFAIGFYKVVELRRRENARDGKGAVAMLGVVVGLMFLMNEAPYRTLHRRDFERVDLNGVRCYITGEAGDEFLVLCPGAAPPRNRTIRRGDPQLRRLDIIENVFKGINSGSAAR